MKNKIDYFDLLLKIIMILATILVVYWFIQIMLEGSPSIEQFNIGLVLVIIGLIVHLYHLTGRFSQFIEGTFPRFEKNIEHSFNKVKEDMTLLKSDTNSLKQDLNLIKKKLKI